MNAYDTGFVCLCIEDEDEDSRDGDDEDDDDDDSSCNFLTAYSATKWMLIK
jgi:hypothetical protein